MSISETAIELVAEKALTQRYMLDFPFEAAQILETMPARVIAEILEAQVISAVLPLWQYFAVDVAEHVFLQLTEVRQLKLLTELDPAISVKILSRAGGSKVDSVLASLDKHVAVEIKALLEFPEDSAGRLMDPRAVNLRPQMTVEQAQLKLRSSKPKAVNEVYAVDDQGVLAGRVAIQEIAIADPDTTIQDIMAPILTYVQALDPKEDVVDKLEKYKLNSIPVVDFNMQLIGVIRSARLLKAFQEEMSVDIQTMVGASKDERALSKTSFAVAKRLPWLHINLLTAFLASAVVGIFESTIAQFTALAVLLPVVAGQSGNAGAQSLAVTMRGLALREISVRHWPKVVLKEVNVGLLNGAAIALTTAACVYIWSQSAGLALVIAIAMVISMIAAGFSGAVIPITLRRFGQDPAQSSSIILTTVTDVVGFFSFLGTAAVLATML
ncbi:MAG: magnesium transporter [Gammaproteobacteria bacterium]|nr:magnesium transporter [Gammaproteobacteria bacterium]